MTTLVGKQGLPVAHRRLSLTMLLSKNIDLEVPLRVRRKLFDSIRSFIRFRNLVPGPGAGWIKDLVGRVTDIMQIAMP
jgi:hypothetical protein